MLALNFIIFTENINSSGICKHFSINVNNFTIPGPGHLGISEHALDSIIYRLSTRGKYVCFLTTIPILTSILFSPIITLKTDFFFF